MGRAPRELRELRLLLVFPSRAPREVRLLLVFPSRVPQALCLGQAEHLQGAPLALKPQRALRAAGAEVIRAPLQRVLQMARGQVVVPG